MNVLIDELLVSAALESGAEIKREPVDLKAFFEQYFAHSVDASVPPSARLNGHKIYLRRAIENLIENAKAHASDQYQAHATIDAGMLNVADQR